MSDLMTCKKCQSFQICKVEYDFGLVEDDIEFMSWSKYGSPETLKKLRQFIASICKYYKEVDEE